MTVVDLKVPKRTKRSLPLDQATDASRLLQASRIPPLLHALAVEIDDGHVPLNLNRAKNP